MIDMKNIERDRKLTPELVDIAKHQVEQQKQLDALSDALKSLRKDNESLRINLLDRTMRLHTIEIGVRSIAKDVELVGAALTDLLADLMPAQDMRGEVSTLRSCMQTILARLESIDASIDALEGERHV